MKEKNIYLDYFKRTALVWALFIVCIYSVVACEFESLRIKWLSIDKEVAFVNKVNGIIENLSFSYIAGVIFFFLSDTIPYIRRKTIAYKNAERSLRLILKSIDEFSLSINNEIWNEGTDAISIYEDYFGEELSDENQSILIKKPLLFDTLKLVRYVNSGISFLLSQELYLDAKLINDIESIKLSEEWHYVSSLSDGNEVRVSSKIVLAIIKKIISIKATVNKYILS